MTKADENDKNQEIVKSPSHRQRRSVLKTIIEEGRISPGEILIPLGIRLANVRYHVDVLVRWRMIELVGPEARRAVVAHFYSAMIEEPCASSLLCIDPPSNRFEASE